jgi:hypothetical protein
VEQVEETAFPAVGQTAFPAVEQVEDTAFPAMEQVEETAFPAVGQVEETEVFGSPLEFPPKFTLSSSEQLHPKFDIDKQTPVELKRLNIVAKCNKQQRISTPPMIQLTSHAGLCSAVQSDTTNRVISSNIPHILPPTASESILSTPVPSASSVFSPPLTRSAARK